MISQNQFLQTMAAKHIYIEIKIIFILNESDFVIEKHVIFMSNWADCICKKKNKKNKLCSRTKLCDAENNQQVC